MENYIDLLQQHAEITQGEFNPTNITVKGSTETTITLAFGHCGKERKLKRVLIFNNVLYLCL